MNQKNNIGSSISWGIWYNLGLLVIIGAIYWVGMYLSDKLWSFRLTIILMTLFVMLVSRGVTGKFWYGWLINEQGRMSLSRLQMFLWTVLILSAFITSIFVNITYGTGLNVLNIRIPEEIWWAMGISTTSLVASPLILERKDKGKCKLTSIGEVELGENKKTITFNTVPSISDLFNGEFESNCDIVDLSRLQNLIFTLILVFAYGSELFQTIYLAEIKTEHIRTFPAINSSFIALLAISHSGYLGMKGKQK